MSNRELSVFMVLIHNNNTERNAYIRPRLVELQTRLSVRVEAELLEVAHQPQIKPQGLPMAILRDVIYQALDRDWLRYRHQPSFLPRHIASYLRSSLKPGRYSRGGGWRRSSAIEMMVTDKHIRAWTTFLETGADFLICFEDDAVFKDDSIQRVADLLATLAHNYPGEPVYVDLAGGFRLEELRIDKLESRRDASFRYYSKPVTNTACTYLMSRPLVAHFHDTLTRRPWLRLISVDWMMNKLFMLIEKGGIQCHCMHADPTIFKHGSTTGEYACWTR
jgi:hypothetical protein